jgi:hypothetical protein
MRPETGDAFLRRAGSRCSRAVKNVVPDPASGGMIESFRRVEDYPAGCDASGAGITPSCCISPS